VRAALLALLTACAPLPAQFWSRLANPTVDVEIPHPPDLGLRLDRVAFAPPRDAASRELADALLSELTRSGAAQVVDRSRAGALLMVDVERDEARHEETVKEDKDREGRIKSTTRTATTRLDYGARIQVVELGTGKVHDVLRVDEHPRASASSERTKPAPPDVAPLRRQVREEAVAKAMKQLLPWTETLKITFFDDKRYGMEEAFKRLEAGDRKGAWELARRGADSARADAGGETKFRGRALHNLGVLAFQEGRREAALAAFREAREILPDASIFKDAVKDCERATALAEALAKFRTPTEARSGSGAGGSRSVEERLEALDRLRRKGLITEAEFQSRKAEILREI
jgi:tetratricopeptide (TPR) repeat protein